MSEQLQNLNWKIVERGKIDTSNTQIHDLWPLIHKYMTTQLQNTIPLRMKQSSSSIVLYRNYLSESIVNNPLSFSTHFTFGPFMQLLIQEKQNTFLYYVRKQVMSVAQTVNRTIRIERKKRIYAI